jgi:hypothetical protein
VKAERARDEAARALAALQNPGGGR